MDSTTGSVLMEEYDLMKQSKYRMYMTNIDKTLKNFEYSSEWADLISALGKLNKVISTYPQYQIIPRRIKISKRLAQCMHPALPSGVHLKALETYDVIFSNTGVERLASELFIYSAGLFPLLGYAAMNVRPALLGIYEKYFVPLGERLRPALSGFLSGVLPGYESGLDHFDRTNSLLNQVCTAVSSIYFYTCLWECVATNASIRLPAVSYLLDHFNKRLGMNEQKYFMGKNHEVMMSGLCACLNDSVILVQRNTLEFLLLGFPMHTNFLTNNDLIKLVTNGLNTILRRDMSLNRRLYSWLLGTEVNRTFVDDNSDSKLINQNNSQISNIYFDRYSQDVLIKALQCTLKISLESTPVDLRPYRILVSLLDKVEIGPVILDNVLCDVIRTMSLSNGNSEVGKSGNVLFATFDPAYIWNFMTNLYEKSCKLANEIELSVNTANRNFVCNKIIPEVGSGQPNLIEVCYLTEFLLETISLETYTETSVYLPRVFLVITQMLTIYSTSLTYDEVTASLKLCMKIVSRVQPMITSPSKLHESNPINMKNNNNNEITKSNTLQDNGNALEKSKSDSKLNQTSLDDEPIKRSNSNQNMSKKSPKKTKKSKSYSKLLELDKEICTEAGQLIIPTAVSTPNLESQPQNTKKFNKNKKASPKPKLKTQVNYKNDVEYQLQLNPLQLSTNDKEIKLGDNTNDETNSIDNSSTDNSPDINPINSKIVSPSSNTLDDSLEKITNIQEYSIIKKCIKQYEIFFQVYLSQQILQIKDNEKERKHTNVKDSEIILNIVNQENYSNEMLKTNNKNKEKIQFMNENIIEDDNNERILKIEEIFNTLRINLECRYKKLNNLLYQTLTSPKNSVSDLSESAELLNNLNTNCDIKMVTFNINNSYSSYSSNSNQCDDNINDLISKLMNIKLSDSLRNSIKLASNLLVDMSTFPICNQKLIIDYTEPDIPCWLKVLSCVACYSKSDKELQISAISTLIELFSLLKSQVKQGTKPGVTFVVMLPLLKFGHVIFLETRTRVFQILTSILWDYLGDLSVESSQISYLLYQLHTCLDSGLVESVIGHRLSNTQSSWSTKDGSKTKASKSTTLTDRLNDYKVDRLFDVRIMCLPPPTAQIINCNDYLNESNSEGFKKFELLWHLGRDCQFSKGFEQTLLKMFDHLSLPYHISIRTCVTKWLQESLLRGDLCRLLKPLLNIVLATNTKRIGVVHAHLLKRDNESTDIWYYPEKETGEDDDKNIIEKDVYAISSEDGNVKYHMPMVNNKKKSPIKSLQKKFFGVTLGNNKNNLTKTSNYISDKSQILNIPENNNNISVIINPLDNSSDIESVNDPEQTSLSSSAPTMIIDNNTLQNEIKQISSSLKDEYYSSSEEDQKEFDESQTSDSDTDKQHESVDDCSNTSIQNSEPISVKRYVGDCNKVSEVLSEHDRTKNRKTYQVTTSLVQKTSISNIQQNENINWEQNITSIGGQTYLEFSTSAEEYFGNALNSTDNFVDTVLNEVIEHSVEQSENVDEDGNNFDKLYRSSKLNRNRNVDKKLCDGNFTKNYNNEEKDIDTTTISSQKRESTSSSIGGCSNSSRDNDRKEKCSSMEPSITDTNSDDNNSEESCENNQITLSMRNSLMKLETSQTIEEIKVISIEDKTELIPSVTPNDSGVKKQNNNKCKDKAQIIADMKINWERSKQNVEILRQDAGFDSSSNRKISKYHSSEDRKKMFDKLHPFHTHMLLYYGVYDTKQVLYAFQTLRNIISCDCRTFLCLSVTTSCTNCPLKQFLIRHRKSIFGKGYTGNIINTEFSHTYRGCMYLEALVTICLYYARSFFQKESLELNKLPTSDDITGNCKIQLASLELLTVLCSELISIVKDMGKGLACYIADLLAKCKLQKIILHCVISSVHSFTFKNGVTFTEQIIAFNDPGDEKLHSESIQVQLLRLLLSVIKLEHEVMIQKGDDITITPTPVIKSTAQSDIGNGNSLSQSPTRAGPSTPTNVKYLANCTISQQPMFLSAILSALQAEHLRALHRNWTDLVTSSLSYLTFGSLTNVVISVIHQVCANIDKITRGSGKQIVNVSPDYALSQLEALTVLCHYCLLDNNQQVSLSHIFNQTFPQNNSSSQANNPGQIFNNLVHVFLSSPLLSNDSNQSQGKTSHQMAARNAVLSHLPRIIASVATLWENDIGQTRLVKQQLQEFLSPISLHHGVNFLAAISVAWQERGETNRKSQENVSTSASFSKTSSNSLNSNVNATRKNSFIGCTTKSLPQACAGQLILVKLVSGIRVMPMDSFVQTLHQVVKSPPPMHHPPAGLSLDVSALELFYFYMKEALPPQLADCWTSLLALLRDGLSLTPPAQFVMLAILNEFVQRHCLQMPFHDKKDLRDLHDITSRLVEALSTIAGSCLEQTTWLRRNLAVKEDIAVGLLDGTIREGTQVSGTQHYSVQAQSVLAAVLANLLDIAYGSQEKDKVVTIVTTLMYNITPYLKNHTTRNIPSFYACSNLLANISSYQYTRKAWRKDVLDLLLDPAFFQMDSSCLPFWKSILDSLMTYDNTTFRELMNRVSLTQTGSLNIFTSREQEYEQRAILLKRLAFVIFCSELDQYHKYMPEIQEQLANSLRLPQVVPSVQAAVFLCFRVLLLRMSPDHVTSLWPIIIAEMVQVFLAIEQELMTDTEEFSQHIRMLSGLDTAWVTNTSNGLHSLGHPNWRMVQLETVKLLELGCVLPATNLPHFQMYRWAFVGGYPDYSSDAINGDVIDYEHVQTPVVFVPHVTRIARLMDFRYTTHSPKPQWLKGNHLFLTCQQITSLQDLYGFFSTLGVTWPPHNFGGAENDISSCLNEIEKILSADFLEKMPTSQLQR